MPKNSEKLFLTNIINNESLKEQLDNCVSIINDNKSLHYTLVVDGQSLGFILNTTNESIFSEMSLKCGAVICCRLSPLQKALVNKIKNILYIIAKLRNCKYLIYLSYIHSRLLD